MFTFTVFSSKGQSKVSAIRSHYVITSDNRRNIQRIPSFRESVEEEQEITKERDGIEQ